VGWHVMVHGKGRCFDDFPWENQLVLCTLIQEQFSINFHLVESPSLAFQSPCDSNGVLAPGQFPSPVSCQVQFVPVENHPPQTQVFETVDPCQVFRELSHIQVWVDNSNLLVCFRVYPFLVSGGLNILVVCYQIYPFLASDGLDLLACFRVYPFLVSGGLNHPVF